MSISNGLTGHFLYVRAAEVVVRALLHPEKCHGKQLLVAEPLSLYEVIAAVLDVTGKGAMCEVASALPTMQTTAVQAAINKPPAGVRARYVFGSLPKPATLKMWMRANSQALKR